MVSFSSTTQGKIMTYEQTQNLVNSLEIIEKSSANNTVILVVILITVVVGLTHKLVK